MATVEKRGNYIYLNVQGIWYCYDETSRPLGAGAMGVVYLGTRYDNHERVAIKRLFDDYAAVPSIRERARLEGELMFRHSNLVEMLGYCELYPTKGPVFIISKFVQGQNIDSFISQTMKSSPAKIRVPKICEMLYPIMDALAYLHDKGVVHLDIKPSNIMVENGRNVRLMDLGIAHVDSKFEHGGGSSSSGLMGTPKYAAPEQFMTNLVSNNLTLSPKTDIYEVGVTLYELLTGNNPFTSKTLQGAIKLHNELILPYSKDVPKAVIDVLRVATAPRQEDRFQSMSAFKNAIRQSLLVKPSFTWVYFVVGAIAAILIILSMFIIFLK